MDTNIIAIIGFSILALGIIVFFAILANKSLNESRKILDFNKEIMSDRDSLKKKYDKLESELSKIKSDLEIRKVEG